MTDVAKRHQMKIAKRTLAMTPAGARIMGGMDFETAYQLVYRQDLRERLEGLVREYPDDTGLCWELEKYGYRPSELLALL